MDFFELVDGLESFLADAVQRLIHRLRVHGLEAAFDASAAGRTF